MIATEKYAATNTKNRLELLTNELGELEKQKSKDFQTKFSNVRKELLSRNVEASKEIFHERFVGNEQEMRQYHQSPCVSNMNFEEIYSLLFTNGEVDIEKVLCLHLLSAHETEHLMLSAKFEKFSETSLERLKEKAKKSHEETKHDVVLPTFILDVNEKDKENHQVQIRNNNGRLTPRLLVNKKIAELIRTVTKTLANTNPGKMEQLLKMAEDIDGIKTMFSKGHIQKFLKLLKNHSLITSSHSFIFTHPYKIHPIHLEVRTKTENLENLVKYIRDNVQETPIRDVWKDMYRKSLLNKPKELPSTTRKIVIDKTNKLEAKSTEDELNKEFRRVNKNFITKNIEAVANGKRNSLHKTINDYSPSGNNRRSFINSSSNSRNAGIRGSNEKKLQDDSKIEASSLNQLSAADDNNPNKTLNQPKSSMKSTDDGTETTINKPSPHNMMKYHLKQTTCKACMERWKISLPKPKVSKLPTRNNSSQISSEDEVLLKTNSIHRLSMMINRELHKLDSYDRKFSNDSSTRRYSSNELRKLSRRYFEQKFDSLDLARIEKEIRERETKKKLERFLE